MTRKGVNYFLLEHEWVQVTVCNKPFQGLQQQEDFQLLKTKAQHLQQP